MNDENLVRRLPAVVAHVRKLARGAPITLLGERNVVWLRVFIACLSNGTSNPSFFAKRFMSDDGGHMLYYSYEGVRWIRGHHRRDSEAVRALRAVAAVLRA